MATDKGGKMYAAKTFPGAKVNPGPEMRLCLTISQFCYPLPISRLTLIQKLFVDFVDVTEYPGSLRLSYTSAAWQEHERESILP